MLEGQEGVAEEITEATPQESTSEATEVQTEVAEPQLFELPDGTKLTAEELHKEYTHNLLPEFTRRSQELSALKKAQEAPQEEQKPYYENPEWEAETTAELLAAAREAAKNDVLNEMKQKQLAELQEKQKLEEYVSRETEELKKLDKDVDVNRVMVHAAKYKFNSLIPAYANLKEMDQVRQLTEQKTLKNAHKKQDVVSTNNESTSAGVTPPSNLSPREQAMWMLKHLNS